MIVQYSETQKARMKLPMARPVDPLSEAAGAVWSKVIRIVPTSVQQQPSQTALLGLSPATVAMMGVSREVA